MGYLSQRNKVLLNINDFFFRRSLYSFIAIKEFENLAQMWLTF